MLKKTTMKLKQSRRKHDFNSPLVDKVPEISMTGSSSPPKHTQTYNPNQYIPFTQGMWENTFPTIDIISPTKKREESIIRPKVEKRYQLQINTKPTLNPHIHH